MEENFPFFPISFRFGLEIWNFSEKCLQKSARLIFVEEKSEVGSIAQASLQR